MVSLDFTAVLFTLSFIAFLGIMKLCFFDPIARVINKREGFIAENLLASKSLQQQIENDINSKNPSDLLTQARHEAHQIVSDSLAAANNNKQKFLDEHKLKLQENISANLESLNQETDKIRTNIDSLINEVVTVAVDKIVTETQKPKTREAIRS